MQHIRQPDPDVVTTAMPDGELIMLHLGTGMCYTLNATGALIWNLLESATSLAVIGQALFDRFDVTRDAADEEVRELMRDLAAHNLFAQSESGSGLS